jgi:hypothetical protein
MMMLNMNSALLAQLMEKALCYHLVTIKSAREAAAFSGDDETMRAGPFFNVLDLF